MKFNSALSDLSSVINRIAVYSKNSRDGGAQFHRQLLKVNSVAVHGKGYCILKKNTHTIFLESNFLVANKICQMKVNIHYAKTCKSKWNENTVVKDYVR